MYDKLKAYDEFESVDIEDSDWKNKINEKKHGLLAEMEKKLQELTIIPGETTQEVTNEDIKKYLKILTGKKHLVTIFSPNTRDDTLEDVIFNAFMIAVKKTISEDTIDYDTFHRSLAKELLWSIVRSRVRCR
ncbi:unnamed protein product [Didymodactylos carnosus]|uniref:Uncharacterized protein n=1 Tax=Didymodactylos carnosus TaxID=1234261 RepID=A0A8S2FXF3_9BILA|nr:unnamed protein product [Didymodactylos carnosus]CAF4381804.1 unnamed protein product [Didymodactylos carnosus]